MENEQESCTVSLELRVFNHLSTASNSFYYLTSFDQHRGKPGIKLGKNTNQESLRASCGAGGVKFEKTAIMTFTAKYV